MTAMNVPLKVLALVAPLVMLAGASPAAAQPARLYELVEQLDLGTLEATGHRLSNWAAQGTADVGTPFCPSELIAYLQSLTPPLVTGNPTSCTVTAFGSDDVDLTPYFAFLFYGAPLPDKLTGKLLPTRVSIVVNADNSVDAPEGVVLTGTITGDLEIPVTGPDVVVPDLGAKKSLLGPAFPIIRLTNGVWTPDDPGLGLTGASFTGTFRLPFQVGRNGHRHKPERGKQAFYLADDGSLIRLKSNEYALGAATLRAEVSHFGP